MKKPLITVLTICACYLFASIKKGSFDIVYWSYVEREATVIMMIICSITYLMLTDKNGDFQ